MMRKWRNHLYLAALIFIMMAVLTLWYSDILNGVRYILFPEQKGTPWLLDMDVVVNPEKHPFRTNITNSSEETRKNNKRIRPRFPNVDFWTQVNDKIYVYSAYQDNTRRINGTVVKIVGMGLALAHNGLRLQCLLKHKTTKQLSDNVYSASRILREKHGAPYSATFFYCFSRNTAVPSHVALREISSNRTSRWLLVHKAINKTEPCDIAVCVRPLYGPFDNLKLLAEFLAFYSSQGVTSFTLYEHSITKKLRSYLTKLRKGGMEIDLLNWKLPEVLVSSSWQHGQVASIQDCLLRNSPIARFVLLVDLDEFLVPRKHFTIVDLMEELSSRTKHKVGSFIFRQSYFCEVRSPERKIEFPLLTSEWTFREDKIWPSKQRSKLIVRPETVLEGGIHFVWKHVLGWKEAAVPWELAVIHHYNQQWCKENKNKTLIEDDEAESFKYEIIYSEPMVQWRKMLKF